MFFRRKIHQYFLGCGLAFACVSASATWFINEDYKQLDARGASDFEILFKGNVISKIAGGGESGVTNPFSNPTRPPPVLDAFGNTVVRYTGTGTIPANTTTDRHFGLFGEGKKPQILSKRWSFASAPTTVPLPVLDTSFLYDAGMETLAITVQNLSDSAISLTDAGYFVSPAMLDIAELNRDQLPPSVFLSLPDLNGLYTPQNNTQTTILSNINPTDWIVTYNTTQFSDPGFDYTETAGNWGQVLASSQIPEPGTLFLLILGFFGLILARAGNSGGTIRAFAAISICVAPGYAAANAFVLPLVPGASNEGPVVRVTITVGGRAVPMNLLIDTGDQIARDGGLYINNRATNNMAGRLGGLPGGTAGNVNGAGGGGSTRNGAPLPNPMNYQSAPLTPGGQTTTTPTLPNAATVGTLPTSMDAVIGSQWLSTYQYGRMTGDGGDYFFLAAKDQGANGVANSVSIANFLANSAPVAVRVSDGRPVGTISAPLTALTPVSSAPDTTAFDGGYAVAAQVSTCPACTAVSSSFLISSSFPRSLISEDLSLALGMDITMLPTDLFRDDFSDTTAMPATPLYLDVFGQAELISNLTVGVLPDSLNPYGLNYLGSDFLQSYSRYWEINTSDDNSTGYLYVISRVPEPSSLALLTLGVVLSFAASKNLKRS